MIPRPEPLASTDSAQLAALEAAATALPWSESQYSGSFASGHFGWGYRNGDDGEPKSWAAFVLFSQVLDEASLLNVATHPDRRRRGLARQLLEYSLEVLRDRGVTAVFLEVRVGNTGAIALYRDLGFADCGLRRGYYPVMDVLTAANGPRLAHEREDALVMRRALVDTVL